ncbi:MULTISPECIES: type I secretion system permease/ATPase [unclassified Ruegeria]|uniref:type I secretion system permease/ATPase n=1 Tax=unclassified Ruegeria TaxID=2625375 RepID=UPI00148865A7|nr:type I secretion system permease/ATPase [Ruegeria sp. HKCCD7296]NOD47433.1 type I secretion system permease/ATPase [Ruegeria sp. HKCCD5849]NOD53174.1 type I secretion system permease/ATPase [Ruegeria sp. HKCCD5851]NOD66367.1 type I secretion system permease/ATPase [Ruegeria sp. HKCCD7303]NOE34144.1 type I secretion system permease/ATPase [Ruegeria sp. HKCCD7318]NOE43553.1 type I secretion system permease/ATPase [Ruegeria sp. HKCCD7319]
MKSEHRLSAPQRHELRNVRNQGIAFLALAFLFSIFVNLLMLTGPLFMLQVYDRVLGSRAVETLTALFLLVAMLYALMAMLDFARGRIVARFGARFQSQLDERVFEATMRRSLVPQVRSAPATALRDLESIRNLCSSPVLLAVMDLPWTPVFLGAIFLFHPLLGWLAVGSGVVLVAIALLNQAMTSRKVAEAQSATARANAFSEHARQAAEVVRSQGMQADVTKRWLKQRSDALTQSVAASDWTGSFTSLTKSLRLFLQSAMLALGAWLVLQNEMTPGAMIAGSILLGRALAPVEQAVGQWNVVERARTAWVSLNRFLDHTPPEEKRIRLPVPKAQLEAKSLTVIPPGASTPTLRNVNLKLEPGKALGVIGKSGSGKTTLAKALLGLWRPAAGEIRLGGATLDQYDPNDLGSHIGYLPQQVTLFNGTVAENIARMSENPDSEAVVAAAKKANAHELILSLEKGYGTFLEGNDSQLSGGQKQRIALARALYGNPVLLILDEPNSALDADGTDALNTAVRGLKAAGKSTIIMTHRPQAISECDDLAVVEKGQVVKFGSRDEVLNAMVQNAGAIKRKLSPVGE